MSIIALGLNHRTAPIEVRERVAFAPERLKDALREMLSLPLVREGAIVSTCNRTEVYAAVSDEGDGEVLRWFPSAHGLSEDEVRPYIYVHQEGEAIRHLLRVSCGLDSLVLGEPQILGQIKTAYAQAGEAQSVGPVLNRMFQHAFSVAKQVRTDTAIGASPVSVAFAAVNLARQIFGDLGSKTALLIGAGETIELAARHLHGNGVGRLVVANRTFERAHALAEPLGGYAIALHELSEHLHEADIVITATASQLPILGKGAVESALKRRKRRPMFMVDIAVPRDIEPEVGALEDVYLYTVDDLEQVIDENRRSRQEAAQQAEEIIDAQVGHFLDWLRMQGGTAVIRELRANAERVRDMALEHALQQLAHGHAPEDTLRHLAHALTNKLMHAPTIALREACQSGQVEVTEAARLLFDLSRD
ncbi:MAG: glutamyl-tRNA reductase [Halothiobacillaceae bacterium]|nr:MAG: glutamyl-tRNA reductase [Halothiobacillaceae bacterium]